LDSLDLEDENRLYLNQSYVIRREVLKMEDVSTVQGVHSSGNPHLEKIIQLIHCQIDIEANKRKNNVAIH